jgi:hypothetical protein
MTRLPCAAQSSSQSDTDGIGSRSQAASGKARQFIVMVTLARFADTSQPILGPLS